MPSPFTVIFPAGTLMDNTMTVMISTTDDMAAEGDHDFTVMIDSTSPSVTVGSPSSVTATILDNDRKLEV